MSNIQIIEKKLKVRYADMIKLQLILYCFQKRLSFSDNEINCLVVLCAYKKYNLSDFCNLVTQKGIFKSAQTVRNFIQKAIDMNIVVREDNNKRSISINPSLEINNGSNVLLNYQFLYVSEE